MLNRIRQFFLHYSKLDLLNWFSIIILIALLFATVQHKWGRWFAWSLFGASLVWLVVLHREMDATVTSWRKKRAEMESRGNLGKFLLYMKKSELELWGYWMVLLFTDWLGLFLGTSALGLDGLGRVAVVPFFIISFAGMVASMVYLGMYFYRKSRLEQRSL